MDLSKVFGNGWGVQGDKNKWNMPGWKVERPYKNETLMGNWVEERQHFTRQNYKHLNSHRLDYPDLGYRRPDTWNRRHNAIRNEGLPADLFTRHHDDRWDDYCITTYDERYNHRVREKKRNHLPPLRKLNLIKEVGWKPEQTDIPVEGKPTNWGLYEKKQKEWEDQLHGWKNLWKKSRYECVYKPYKQEAFPARYGITPRSLSSQIHPTTTVNKNMALRGDKRGIAPERPPSIPKPSEKYPFIASQPCR